MKEEGGIRIGVVSNCGDGEYYDLTIAFGFWIVGLDFLSFWMGIYLPSLWVFWCSWILDRDVFPDLLSKRIDEMG